MQYFGGFSNLMELVLGSLSTAHVFGTKDFGAFVKSLNSIYFHVLFTLHCIRTFKRICVAHTAPLD